MGRESGAAGCEPGTQRRGLAGLPSSSAFSSLAPTPRALLPTMPTHTSAFRGEEREDISTLSIGGRVPSGSDFLLSPASTRRLPHYTSARLSIRGAPDHSRLRCCFRDPQRPPRAGLRPQRRGRAPEGPLPQALHPPSLSPRRPPSADPGDLSYTGPGGCGLVPASHSKRSPRSPAKPRAGRAGGGSVAPAPPCWFLVGPYVGSKK